MLLDEHHEQLTSFAYNIIGSYQDAKDIVQEVVLERMSGNGSAVRNEKAYLVRSVINRAINFKNRQKKILSDYPGNWLPEPVATEYADDELHRKDILSYSLMVLMEKLDARARAVFILKEAFDYEHEEIASVLNISTQNSRKILSRAKKQLSVTNTSTASSIPAGYLRQYIDIIHKGDIKKLEALLNKDIIVTSDGGGKAVAAQKRLTGRAPAMLFLSGIYRKFYRHAIVKAGMVNHQPAIFYFENGALVTCQIIELQGERIHRIYFMRNPDKLSALGASLRQSPHFLSDTHLLEPAL